MSDFVCLLPGLRKNYMTYYLKLGGRIQYWSEKNLLSFGADPVEGRIQEIRFYFLYCWVITSQIAGGIHFFLICLFSELIHDCAIW